MEPWFLQLTRAVCQACGIPDLPNCCNGNRYASGDESVGWHSDDEALFQAAAQDALIVSLSLGATRTFRVRLKDHAAEGDGLVGAEVLLGDGDLCTMEGLCQKHYQHCVPKEASVSEPRINLTWRWIVSHGRGCPRGAPEGTPLREKLEALVETRRRLAELKRKRDAGLPGGTSAATAERLASLAE
ncbi:unnamed protein product, partial [Prorocentrum cordatum]